LNWRLFEYAEAKIDQAQITVHLPQNTLTKDDLFVWGHGLSTGTITIVNNNQIFFDMKNIKDGEFPEFRILMDNSLFPLVAPNNIFITPSMTYNTISSYEDELIEQYNLRIILAGNILLASATVFLLMGFIAYMVYRKYDKEYQPEFTGDYYRELPNDDTPAEVSYLYFMKKINNESVTATLLDLIQREYIRLEPHQKKHDDIENFDLTVNVTSDRSKLKKHEIHFLDWMFLKIGDGKRVSTNQIENYGVSDITKARSFKTNAQTFIRLAKQESRKHKYFETSAQKNKIKILSFNLIPGIMIIVSLVYGSIYALNNILSIIVCFVALVLFTIYVHSIKKRSIEGNELFTKWKAFKKFLTDFSGMDDYPIPSVTVWEHYLVYATVLGVADKVMDQLKVKLPAEEITRSRSSFLYSGYNSRDYYYRSLSNRFRTSFASAAVNSHRTVVTYNVSKLSSGGGGGGFGGGSSGGGGGGGGRSR